MAEKLTFFKIAKLTLERTKRPLTPYEIWEEFSKLEEAKNFSTKGKTPWHTIGAEIYVDLRDNPDSEFHLFSKRPSRFTLKKYADIEGGRSEKIVKERSFHERDLHPLLSVFVYANQHFKSRVKTIKHEHSKTKKKGQNEWLHPDLVGVYFPFDDYHEKTIKIQTSLLSNSVKLYSFEMKKELDFSNLREYYFQAVSNSSWANEGYLVVANLNDDSEFIDELRRLNNSFGIGLIKLNIENIHESEILFQSKGNIELDWGTINRLVEDNTDFEDFIINVEEDIRIGKVKGTYDQILTETELEDYKRIKKIS